MVEELELENLSSFGKSPRQSNIGLARGWITRRVVVLCGARRYVQCGGRIIGICVVYHARVNPSAAHN